MKPTYLYIKEHSVTGLKYFGKTYNQHPDNYLGSGKYWKKHIKKHGEEFVKTTWCKLFADEKELTDYATKFSEENNIVDSKEWANLKNENGLDGGMEKGWWSEEQRKNISDRQKQRWANGVYDPEKLRLSRIGFKQPQSQKDKVSKALSKQWKITDPIGNIFIIENLREYCEENHIDQGNMVKVSQGKLKQHKGYLCEKLS